MKSPCRAVPQGRYPVNSDGNTDCVPNGARRKKLSWLVLVKLGSETTEHRELVCPGFTISSSVKWVS